MRARWLEWTTVAVVAAGALAACSAPAAAGDAPPDEAPPGDAPLLDDLASGARLKIRAYDFGGTRHPLGLHDAERGDDCTPELWTTGQHYCTPTDAMGVVYTDAACTQPVGEHYPSATCPRPTPKYILVSEQVGCQARPARLAARGARLTLAQYYLAGSDGSCLGPFTPGGYEHYALGATVPTSELAPLGIGPPVGGGRIAPRSYESLDGVRLPYRPHDTALATDCTLRSRLNARAGRCVPEGTIVATLFRDAACTQPLARERAACPAPAYLEATDDCTHSDDDVFARGPVTTVPPLFDRLTTACTMVSPTSTPSTYYRVGPQVQLATTTRAPAAGERRIVPVYHVDGGAPVRDTALHDTQLGSDCTPYTFGDGTVRCVPTGSSHQTMYTDSACQNAVQIMDLFRGSIACAAPPVPVFAVRYLAAPAGTCLHSYEVRPVLEAHTGPLYRLLGTTCSAYTPSTTVPYRVGAPIPLDQLVAATVVVDP